MGTKLDRAVTAVLLERAGIRVATDGVRGGPCIAISGISDARGTRRLSVGVIIEGESRPRVLVTRTCPVLEFEASAIVERLASGGIPVGEARLRAMLVHLVIAASKLFIENELESFRLSLIAPAKGSYQVIDAELCVEGSAPQMKDLS